MPDWSSAVRSRLSGLHLSPAREAEIIHELSDHLEDRYQELIASGVSPDEATRRALADFRSENALARDLANLRQAKVAASIQHAAPPATIFAGFWYDFRYAVNVAMRRPGHTLAVILCLAVGLTVSIGTFSVLTSLLYGEQPGITIGFVDRPMDGDETGDAHGMPICVAPEVADTLADAKIDTQTEGDQTRLVLVPGE